MFFDHKHIHELFYLSCNHPSDTFCNKKRATFRLSDKSQACLSGHWCYFASVWQWKSRSVSGSQKQNKYALQDNKVATFRCRYSRYCENLSFSVQQCSVMRCRNALNPDLPQDVLIIVLGTTWFPWNKHLFFCQEDTH